MYASFLGALGALHLDIFQHPAHWVFFSNPPEGNFSSRILPKIGGYVNDRSAFQISSQDIGRLFMSMGVGAKSSRSVLLQAPKMD